MDRRVPVVAAAAGAARLIEAGWGSDLKPEERLRRAITVCALERPDVLEVRAEWKSVPQMKLWPSKPKTPLGGFDLAFRMKGDGGVTVVAETKWSGGAGPDALDQTAWDALKLVHAGATIKGIRWALLITAARELAWSAARFASTFEESTTRIGSFLKLNPRMYAEDAKSRPLSLPPFIQSSPAACVAFELDGKPWELRVASVCANGEPWLDCDAEGWPLEEAANANPNAIMDWPHPEAGPGMLLDDGEPFDQPDTPVLPGPDSTWREIIRFAQEVDGYRSHGDRLADMANASVQHFDRERIIDPTLPYDDLRACLFFEARRYHHFGNAPDYEGAQYIRALVAAIAAAQPG